MWKSTLLGVAAAVGITVVGLSSGTASAAPVAQAVQMAQGMERTDITPAHSRYRYRQRYVRRHGPVISFGFYPGFYYGGYYHPRFYYHARAPYHCHRWSHRGRQSRCHRHW